MKAAIENHWRKNMKQEAVYMVAQFANESTDRGLFDDVVKADAPDWFIDWATKL